MYEEHNMSCSKMLAFHLFVIPESAHHLGARPLSEAEPMNRIWPKDRLLSCRVFKDRNSCSCLKPENYLLEARFLAPLGVRSHAWCVPE